MLVSQPCNAIGEDKKMDIKNIQVGNEYKTYTALCQALGVKAKSNKGKVYQIRNMKQYFDFEVQGRKHIITEVYATPQVTQRKTRQVDALSLWSEKALIHLLATSPMLGDGARVVRLTKLDLFEALGFINNYYRDGNYNRDETSEILGVSTFATNHFFDSTYDKARKRVEGLLKRMRSGFNIDYTLRKMICDTNGQHRLPTQRELQMILDYGKETLDEMGCDSLGVVIYQNRYEEYKARYSHKLTNINIKYTYECYEIIVGTRYLKTVEVEYREQQQQGITLDMIRDKINELAKTSNHRTFNTRHKKALKNQPTWGRALAQEDYEAQQLQFLEDGELLFQTCAKLNPHFNLSSSIQNLKNEKKSK